MSKVRVWELARELRLSTGEALKELESLGVKGDTAMSLIDDSDADRLRARLRSSSSRAEADPQGQAESAGERSADLFPPDRSSNPLRVKVSDSPMLHGEGVSPQRHETQSPLREHEEEWGGSIQSDKHEEIQPPTSGEPVPTEPTASPSEQDILVFEEDTRERQEIARVSDERRMRAASGARIVPFEPTVRERPRREPSPAPPPTFGKTINTLRRHSVMVVLCTLLLGAVALFVSTNQTPLFESEATVLVRALPESLEPGARSVAPNMATEVEVVRSDLIALRVIETLALTISSRSLSASLTVESPRDTEILVIRYAHNDPEEARRRAQGYADAYLGYLKEEATQGITALVGALEAELGVLRARLDETNLRSQAAATDEERSALQSQASALQTLILQRELSLTSLRREPNVASIVQAATLPAKPFQPDHATNLGLGLAAGIVLGVGVVLLRDRLDNRVRTSQEVELVLDAPVLTTVPRERDRKRRAGVLLVASRKSQSPAAEAYRALGTNLLSAARSEGTKSVVVTGSAEGEGVTTVVANLGVVLARMGRKVVLISADLRNPKLHDLLRLSNRAGLTDLLTGKASLDQVVRSTAFENLKLITSGSAERSTPEILASERMQSALRELESSADLVIIDSAPLVPVSDTLAVARLVGHVLFVIGPNGRAWEALAFSRDQLEKLGCRILGGVVNNLDPRSMRGFSEF